MAEWKLLRSDFNDPGTQSLSSVAWTSDPYLGSAERLSAPPASSGCRPVERLCRQLCDEIARHTDANDKFLVVKSGVEGAWRNLTDRLTRCLQTHL